jgi:hypothetical protein
MAVMPKVKINPDALETFVQAAAHAGVPVADWLTAAGRQQALVDVVTAEQPGARVVFVPLDPQASAALDRESARARTSDWAYCSRLIRDVVTAGPDLEQLWADVITDVSMLISSAQQRAYVEQVRVETIVGDLVVLVAPDSYTRDVIEARLRPMLIESLTRLLGRQVQIAVTVDTSDRLPSHPPGPAARQAPANRDAALREALDLLRGLRTLPGTAG